MNYVSYLSCSEGQCLTWSNVLWRRILPDTGAPNSLWEEPLWDILGPAPIIKGDWQLYYYGLRIGDGTLSHRQSSLCKCINGRRQMYHKCIKVQLKCITNVSTVNWGQGHQRIREMRIEGRLGVVREHRSVYVWKTSSHWLQRSFVQSGHIAEEVVDVGKGADAANAVKWSPARLRGLEGKGTEGKGWKLGHQGWCENGEQALWL